MGVFLGCDKTIVNGIRVGVLEDDFTNSSCPVKEVIVSTTVRMKEAAFPMMDSKNVKIEEDMCGFLTEDIEKSESLEHSVDGSGADHMRASKQVNKMRTRMTLSRLWIASLQRRNLACARGLL